MISSATYDRCKAAIVYTTAHVLAALPCISFASVPIIHNLFSLLDNSEGFREYKWTWKVVKMSICIPIALTSLYTFPKALIEVSLISERCSRLWNRNLPALICEVEGKRVWTWLDRTPD